MLNKIFQAKYSFFKSLIFLLITFLSLTNNVLAQNYTPNQGPHTQSVTPIPDVGNTTITTPTPTNIVIPDNLGIIQSTQGALNTSTTNINKNRGQDDISSGNKNSTSSVINIDPNSSTVNASTNNPSENTNSSHTEIIIGSNGAMVIKPKKKTIPEYDGIIKIKKETFSPDLWQVYYEFAKELEGAGRNQEAITNYQLAVDTVLDLATVVNTNDKPLKHNLFKDFCNLKINIGDITGALETIDQGLLSEESDILLDAFQKKSTEKQTKISFMDIDLSDLASLTDQKLILISSTPIDNSLNYPSHILLIAENNSNQALETNRRLKLLNSALSDKKEAAKISSNINQEITRPPEHQDPNKIDDLQKQLQQARQNFQQTAMQIQNEFPEMLKFIAIKPTNFRTIQHKLPEDTVIIEPVTFSKKLVLFIAPPGDKPAFIKELALDNNELLSKIVGFRKVLYDKDSKNLLMDSSSALYNLVIKPIEKEISEYKTLVICPYENLRYVPFQAFYDGQQFMTEKFAIVNITSSSALKIGDQKPLKSSKLLAFGNATEDLPAAEEEVLSISQTFPDSMVFVKNQASKEKFDKEILKDFNIIHLATHGILNNDNPESSHLMFAGKENNSLTVADIMGYDFAQKDLIVLSACDSNVGRARGAEITSLGSAFEMAAAPTVISSLWRVNDKATSLMMVDFYNNLKAGLSRVQALQNAQIKLIKNENYNSPYFWAPFVLMGEWK